MRLLTGVLAFVWIVQAHAASREIEMTFRAGSVDYVALQEPVFEATTGVGSLSNLDSYVVKYRGWSLIGEYVYVASFYYSLNPRELHGSKRTIRFAQISKYPDLAKRYEAIRPSSVNFIVWASVETETGVRETRFKVTDNDLVYFGSRSGENYTTPGSPLRWKDAVSFDEVNAFNAADSTTDAELKKILGGFRGFSRLAPPRVFLEVTWPEGEIDRIGVLFEQYEKDGEKLKKDYAFLDDAPREAPYSGPPDRAQPVDFRPKEGEVFHEGNEVGLKVSGKAVFRSSRHSYATPVGGRKTHFIFRLRDGDGSEIYDTKGRQVKIGGYSRFEGFMPNPQGKVALIAMTNSRSIAYRTQKEYSGLEIMTQSDFDRFTRRDGTPDPPKKREPEPNDGIVRLVITAPSYRYEIERMELLELDEKFNVLSREPVYYPRTSR